MLGFADHYFEPLSYFYYCYQRGSGHRVWGVVKGAAAASSNSY
jgi:hypothetical protein